MVGTMGHAGTGCAGAEMRRTEMAMPRITSWGHPQLWLGAGAGTQFDR
eukprot:gene11937-biopygen3390